MIKTSSIKSIIDKILSPKVILMLSAIEILLLIVFIGDDYTGDSRTYGKAWLKLVDGEMHILRTPTYPVFLGIIKTIVGTEWSLFVSACVQYAIFFASIKYFMWIAKKLIQNEKMAMLITLIYAINPVIVSWGSYITTECLSMVGVVMFTYCIIRACDEKSIKYAVFTVIMLLLLVFLRPAFLFLLPICLCVFIFFLFKGGKNRIYAITGLTGTIAVCVCMLLYCNAFKNKFGVFTPSGVSTLNQFVIARKQRVLDDKCITNNDSLKAYIAHVIEKENQRGEFEPEFVVTTTSKAIFTYGLKNMNDAVKLSYKQKSAITPYKKAFKRALHSAGYDSSQAFHKSLQLLCEMINIRLGYIYLMIAIEFLLILRLIRRKKTPWMSAFIIAVLAGQYLVNFIGSMYEYPRLAMPVFPIALILIGQLCANFRFKNTNLDKLP